MNLLGNAFATRQNYIRGLRALILHYQCLPEACSLDQIKAFLVHQRDKKQYSASTVNLRVCGLKYYFSQVAKRLDLVTEIPNPRVAKYDTEILTLAEVQHLRQCCRDMRQRLLVDLLYDAGLRVREVMRVRVSDFDKHQQTITIRNSKGNKTRVVYYGKTLRDSLNQYCKVRGSVPANTLLESYVDKGQALSQRGIQHMVRQLVKRSGIKKRISPHSFRHSFAVHYLNAGGSIRQLQILLGHEQISTTLNYLKYAKPADAKRISVLDELQKLLKGKQA